MRKEGPASRGTEVFFYSIPTGRELLGEADIYVAFKKKDGTWAEPVNLGEKVNSKFYDWAPGITPDGKYIVFSSYRNIEPIVSKYPSYSQALQKDFGRPKIGIWNFLLGGGSCGEKNKRSDQK